MPSYFTGAADPSTRVIGISTSIGRQIQVQIRARRTVFGLRHYSYQLVGSDAQLTLVADKGKTPYFQAAPLFTKQGEVLPLSADTLGIIRAVQAGLTAHYQAGPVGAVAKTFHEWWLALGGGEAMSFLIPILLLVGVGVGLLLYPTHQQTFAGYIVAKKAVPAQWQKARPSQILWTGKTAMLVAGHEARQVTGPQYLIWVANQEETRVLSMTKASWDTLQTGRAFHALLPR